jgi:hypothetical protein
MPALSRAKRIALGLRRTREHLERKSKRSPPRAELNVGRFKGRAGKSIKKKS